MGPSRLRIIIIDDEKCIRESLEMHLNELGHEVVTFEKAFSCPALNEHECALKGACADLVLVDYNMPGMTGLEYLKRMTRHGCLVLPRNRILMTGDATPELVHEVTRMGCRIIQKPLRLKDLEALIEQSRKLSDIE